MKISLMDAGLRPASRKVQHRSRRPQHVLVLTPWSAETRVRARSPRDEKPFDFRRLS